MWVLWCTHGAFWRVQPDEARSIFKEQISALFNAGVDLLLIETITDLYEMQEANIAALKSLVICLWWHP